MKRHLPIRKRIRKALRIPFAVKQLTWRLTAGWLWLWGFASILGLRAHLQMWEDSLFRLLSAWLKHIGFAPSNPTLFNASIKALWLFTISGFSWVQLIGFSLYVATLPFILLVQILLRKRLEPYYKIRQQSFKKSRKAGVPFPKRSWGFPLLCILLLWFLLYGQTIARYPLLLGLCLTALLFCSRVGSALTFALPADGITWARIEGMIASARKYMSDTSEKVKSGEILDTTSLNATIWTASFFLRNFRRWSRWLHGKAARRRMALVVLLRFILNLAALGGISILFWAIAIKFALAPAHVPFSDALLASAARVVPGIPAPVTLNIPAAIQILDSLMAWLIFALYAGPVASLFPAFQEQAIARATANYSRLRTERRAIYQFREPLLPVQEVARENPQLIKIAKAAVLLRTNTQDEIKEALLGQPAALRALASAPLIADMMRQLGAAVPTNLEELAKQLPPPSSGAIGSDESEREAYATTGEDNQQSHEQTSARGCEDCDEFQSAPNEDGE